MIKKNNRRKPVEVELRHRIDELESRLAEAEEALRAIREGEVDALVVSGSHGDQVFSLRGVDSSYREIVETMKEAAFTVTFDGMIMFANAQFGELLQRPLEHVIGHSVRESAGEAQVHSLLTVAQERHRETTHCVGGR